MKRILMLAAATAVAACESGTPAATAPADTSVAEAPDTQPAAMAAAREPVILRIDRSAATPRVLEILRPRGGYAVEADGEGVRIVRPRPTSAAGHNSNSAPMIRLPESWSADAAGRAVNVAIEARSVDGEGDFAVGYYTNSAGNSGFKTFNATPDYQVFRFDYPVKDAAADTPHVIFIDSDPDAEGRGIVIRSVTLTAY